jgi:hypothetical protein
MMGRRESGTFVQVLHCVMDSENWTRCGGSAIRLLLELARQYNGHNNGDLCASISVLKRRGWRSSDVLNRALAELRHYGFIELTRQGGLHRPSLYALAWKRIDPCGGKLEVAPTTTASHTYRAPKPKYRRLPRKKKASPENGERSAGTRINRRAA